MVWCDRTEGRHTLCTLQYLLHLTERLRELLCLLRIHHVSLGVNCAAVVHRGSCSDRRTLPLLGRTVHPASLI